MRENKDHRIIYGKISVNYPLTVVSCSNKGNQHACMHACIHTHIAKLFYKSILKLVIFACSAIVVMVLYSCEDKEGIFKLIITAQDNSQVPYASFQAQNHFDSIGIYHNDILDYALKTFTIASDTLTSANKDTIQNHFNLGLRQFSSALPNPVLISNMDSIISTGYWQIHDHQQRDWPAYLATYSNANLTQRELNYIHRMGSLFTMQFSNSQVYKDSLTQIENDIINEVWSAGDTTEYTARVAISVAKHSFTFWEDVANNNSNLLSPRRKLTKIQRSTLPDWVWRIAGADVAGAIIVGSQTGWDPLSTALGAATASAVQAVVTFWDDLTCWFRKWFGGCGG